MAGGIDDYDSGIVSETASLLEDLSIQVIVVGGRGHNGYKIKPDDSGYGDYKTRFGLIKVGDSKTIDRELIDGKWVDVPHVESSLELED